jgi:hypothetical protein
LRARYLNQRRFAIIFRRAAFASVVPVKNASGPFRGRAGHKGPVPKYWVVACFDPNGLIWIWQWPVLIEAVRKICVRPTRSGRQRGPPSAIGVCRSVRNACGHCQLRLSANDDRTACTAAIATNTRRYPVSFPASSCCPAAARDCNRVGVLTFSSDCQKPCRLSWRPLSSGRKLGPRMSETG